MERGRRLIRLGLAEASDLLCEGDSSALVQEVFADLGSDRRKPRQDGGCLVVNPDRVAAIDRGEWLAPDVWRGCEHGAGEGLAEMLRQLAFGVRRKLLR